MAAVSSIPVRRLRMATHSIISASRASSIGSMVGPSIRLVVDDEFELNRWKPKRAPCAGVCYDFS